MKENRELWIGAQIIIPGQELNNDSRYKEKIEKILSDAKSIVDLNGLMIMGHNNEKTCNIVHDICSRLRIETYLYYPVLADIPNYEATQEAKVVNYEGQRGYGDISLWKRWLDLISKAQDEKFEFLCPNNEEAVNQFFNIYKNRVDTCGLDGVFFDRLRFPSASMGFEMLFSCFCKACQERFSKEFDENLLHYKDVTQIYIEQLKTATPNFFKNARSLQDIVFPKEMKNFLKFRNQSIYRIVKRFSDYAREQGKKVGLDVYSYSLANNVSQDYELLSKTCDWIKPMIYCHARVPSGFSLELYCILRSLISLSSKLKESDILNLFMSILNVDLHDRGDHLIEKGVSEDVIFQEMEKINHLNLPKGVDIYPGIEVMKMGDLCMITEQILENYLRNIINSQAKGMIMSWNILEMPSENLTLIGGYLNRSHR